MFERHQKGFVEVLLFASGLMFEAIALLGWGILFAVSGGDLLAVDAALENLDGARIIGRELGQRNELLRQMRNESRLNEGRFDQLLKDRAGDFEIFVFFADLGAELDGTFAALVR